MVPFLVQFWFHLCVLILLWSPVQNYTTLTELYHPVILHSHSPPITLVRASCSTHPPRVPLHSLILLTVDAPPISRTFFFLLFLFLQFYCTILYFLSPTTSYIQFNCRGFQAGYILLAFLCSLSSMFSRSLGLAAVFLSCLQYIYFDKENQRVASSSVI